MTNFKELDWRPYLGDRKLAKHPDGFFIIVPNDAEPPVPLACGVCNSLFRSRDDEVAHNEFRCCHLCALQWAHARRKEWLGGWRPSPEQVVAVVSQRQPLFVVFDID